MFNEYYAASFAGRILLVFGLARWRFLLNHLRGDLAELRRELRRQARRNEGQVFRGFTE